MQLTLVVQHPLPSLNALFAMTHWQRHDLKHQIQLATLYALQAAAADSSMRTTLLPNTILTHSVTLLSYLRTHQPSRTSKSRRSAWTAKLRNVP
jgi:hypothetical protein